MDTDAPITAAPFFVVGSARSGTTLLRLILNSHPRVAVPPESRFITELMPRSGEIDVREFLTALGRHRRFQSWHVDISKVEKRLEGRGRVPYATAIENTYEAFAEEHGKERWGDKTPRYVEHIDQIAALFPASQFVHLVRDGRNVALSYAHTDFGPKTAAKAAAIWKRRVGLGLEQGRPLGPERYLEVRYEELVENTDVTVKEICRFLHIEFDPQMFDEEERTKGLSDRAQRYNPHVTGKTISHTRSWEEDMPASQVEVFEAVAGPLLQELGYERRFPSPSAAAKVRAKLGLLGMPVDRLDKAERTDQEQG